MTIGSEDRSIFRGERRRTGPSILLKDIVNEEENVRDKHTSF